MHKIGKKSVGSGYNKGALRGVRKDNTADIKIPFSPRPAQLDLLNMLDNHRFNTMVCHRRFGKTYLSVYWLIRECITASVDDFAAYYFGKSQKAAKLVSWRYFKALLAPLHSAKLVFYRETELQVEFWNGSRIILAGSENIESYRGIYVDRLVSDEIASWTNQHYAYFEVLRPALSDRNGKGLFIGTVKGLDMLYELYQRGQSDDVMDKDWASAKYKVTETNILSDIEIEDLRRSMSEDAFAREMMCDFFAESPDVLITPEEIEKAVTKRFSPEEATFNRNSEVVFGVDPGRGGDPTVVYKKQGLIIEKIYSRAIKDSQIVADHISNLIRIHKPVSVFIDVGQGGGVIDRLKKLGHDDKVIEVFFNSASPNPSCYNIRSYIYNNLKLFLQRGKIPDDEALIKQLSNVLLDEDENNRIRLAKKRKIKNLLNGSPNDADALALCFYEEDDYEDPEARKERLIQEYLSLSNISYDNNDYDPLNYLNDL